ncbi:MAG TPA: arginase [Flavobacteriaceae bacterium]|nr:arginase [Flavobacteriaceae bacterium]HEX5743207.1 arginase [Flavobacteriaceae bacterium]
MKEIIVIKNRSDVGAGTRGSDLGIDAIEIAAIVKGDHYFNYYDFEDVPTENETIYNKVKNSFALRIDSVINQCSRVCESVLRNLLFNKFPIVLSGDHSSALGSISGIKAAFPEKKIGVVWIDAHADIHSPYTSPTGNIHGMPLAAALSLDNFPLQVNKVDEETEKLWNKMKNIGIPGPKITFDEIVYFGVRDTEEPEDITIAKNGIKNYSVHEVRYRGFETCINEAIDRLKHCDFIYISFDVDSMDCDLVSDGTGTPVPRGFDADEVTDIIKSFINTEKVICFELVEVNPLLDTKGNKMAETAFEILRTVTNTIEVVNKNRVDA